MLSATSKMEARCNAATVSAWRERTKGNWQVGERNFLLEMISKRKDVLLSRKTDYLTNSNKAGAWEALVQSFHAKFGKRWSATQIKDQWKKIRINAKKDYSNFARESRKTGGGPPPPEPSNLTIIAKELCPNDFVQLKNPFDDDSNQM